MADEKAQVTQLKTKTKDGVEIRYNIEEIENGYIVTVNKEWTDKKGAYQYETRKYYTKNNPLQQKAPNMYEIIRGALGTDKISI